MSVVRAMVRGVGQLIAALGVLAAITVVGCVIPFAIMLACLAIADGGAGGVLTIALLILYFGSGIGLFEYYTKGPPA